MAIYKSSQGKQVDMDELRLKNEEVRALGNMNVNARGDVIDDNNKTISSRKEQVKKGYEKQIKGVPQDLPIGPTVKDSEEIINVVPGLDDEVTDVEESIDITTTGGLSDAISNIEDTE